MFMLEGGWRVWDAHEFLMQFSLMLPIRLLCTAMLKAHTVKYAPVADKRHASYLPNTSITIYFPLKALIERIVDSLISLMNYLVDTTRFYERLQMYKTFKS